MNKDWIGDTRSVKITHGFTGAGNSQEEKTDYYATEPKAVELLLEEENFNINIWECACGGNHMVNALKKQGFYVLATDIINRVGEGVTVYDFLKHKGKWKGDIITNPPYKYAKEFIEKALEVTKHNAKIAMFMKLSFLESNARRQFFKDNPPQTVYVSSARLRCAKNGDFKKAKDAISYAWFIWKKGYKGRTVIKWIN